jgi:hypothetical protein
VDTVAHRYREKEEMAATDLQADENEEKSVQVLCPFILHYKYQTSYYEVIAHVPYRMPHVYKNEYGNW